MNIIISGRKHFGKTTAALKLVELLKAGKVPVGGQLNAGNDLIDVMTDEKEVMFYDIPMPNTIRIGHHHLLLPAVEKAEQLITTSLKAGNYTFIDECGKLELQKQRGFYNIIKQALPYNTCILCIRDMNVDAFFDVFKQDREKTKVFTLTEENRDTLPQTMFEYITQTK